MDDETLSAVRASDPLTGRDVVVVVASLGVVAALGLFATLGILRATGRL